MRSAAKLAIILALGGGVACGPLALMDMLNRGKKNSSYDTPTGDGSHFVSVDTEPNTPTRTARNRWRRRADKACEGDYLVLSENTYERRRGGKVESKVYEGYVRCVSPEPAMRPTAQQTQGE